ncbi:hypothetical protein [Pseudomonas akapageensis]|uniref:hypothetical protein n=1 Tax=Pseudomonas akapageensis TaxID=2609961 RepID=UPI001408BE76|nr:hypothetical protein [Pseudomonas akapageensis]
MIDHNRHIKQLRQAAPYLVSYALFCACIDIYTFWSKFNIKPFAYIGLGEIITYAGNEIFIASAFAIFVLLFEALFPTTEASKKETNHLHKEIKIRFLLGSIVLSLAMYFDSRHEWLTAITFSTMLLIARPLAQTEVFLKAFSAPPIRIALTAFIVFLPVSSIMSANSKANKILSRSDKQDMIRREEGLCSQGCILIGKIGDYFLVMGNNKKTIMIKSDKMTDFEIYVHDFGKS